MKRIFVAFTISVLLAAAVQAQVRPAEQLKAWKKFQTAVLKNDKKLVVSMIVFPLEASIAGEGLDFRVENEADLIKNYNAIFNLKRRQKIARGRIVSDKEADEFRFEMLENGGYHVFTFSKIDGTYKLIGTMAAG